MAPQRWEERSRQINDVGLVNPAPLLAEWLARIPAGRALDLACGGGTHLLAMARAAWCVTGIDSSISALRACRGQATREGLSVALVCADLDTFLLPANRYDLVTVFYYLDRSLFDPIKHALKPGGYLLFETYTSSHLRFRPDFNPAFVLQPGELLRAFESMRIDHYEEIVEQTARGGCKAVAKLVARACF